MIPSLARAMTVRNVEAEIAICLESVRHIADEIMIADTGSNDDTPKIARQHGARVVSIPLEHDFVRARNVALSFVRADWVLVLEPAEQLDSAAAQSLPALLQKADISGYLVRIRDYMLRATRHERVIVEDPSLAISHKHPAYAEYESLRLFRRCSDVSFGGQACEVEPRIRMISGSLGHADLVIHHFGFAAAIESGEIGMRRTAVTAQSTTFRPQPSSALTDIADSQCGCSIQTIPGYPASG